MTPVFSHGDLRLYLLNLLDEGPRHGYDIMQALSDRTGGTYTPSAGTIYPRLAKLEEEGLVTKTVDGRKTVYEITDAGRAEVAARAGDLEGIEAGLDRLGAPDRRRGARQRARGDEEPARRPRRGDARGARRPPTRRRTGRRPAHRAVASRCTGRMPRSTSSAPRCAPTCARTSRAAASSRHPSSTTS